MIEAALSSLMDADTAALAGIALTSAKPHPGRTGTCARLDLINSG
ncbi:hypothetical protein AB0P45_09885 [Streptomyces niveus]